MQEELGKSADKVLQELLFPSTPPAIAAAAAAAAAAAGGPSSHSREAGSSSGGRGSGGGSGGGGGSSLVQIVSEYYLHESLLPEDKDAVGAAVCGVRGPESTRTRS